MARANTIQTNFTSGEVSPLMLGRVDVNKYFNGARKLQNMIVRPQGGAWRRPGTRYVNNVRDQTKKSILQDFRFSNIQPYVLEFSEGHICFYKDGGQITLADTITVTGSNSTNFITDRVYTQTGINIYGRPIYGPLNGDYYIFWNSTQWVIVATLEGSSTTFAVFYSGDNVATPDLVTTWNIVPFMDTTYGVSNLPTVTIQHNALTVATPYLEADLPDLYFTQSADVLYIAHPLFQTRKLLRHSDTAWELVLYDPIDGPYLDEDTSHARLQATNIVDTAILQLTNDSGSTTAVASANTFVVGDVGKYVEFKDALGRWTLGHITAYTNATTVTIDVLPASDFVYPPTNSSIQIAHTSTPDRVSYPPDRSYTQAVVTIAAIGKYIRTTATQSWWLITGIYSTTSYLVSAVSIVTYDTTAVTVKVNASFVIGDVGKYVEYKESGKWKLALITDFLDSGNVRVDPIDEVQYPTDSALLTFSSPHLNSDLSGVFTPVPGKNMFVRANSGAWYKLVTYVNTTQWTVTAVTLKSYTYPDSALILKDRVITATITSSLDTFSPDDLGRWLRMEFGAAVRAMKITSVSSYSQVSVQLMEDSNDFPRDPDDASIYMNAGYADAFRLGAWCDTTGWPSVVSFHEQRLVFSRTNDQVQTIWGSRSGDYESMSPTEPDLTVLADNAYNYTIASNQVNPIAWMETGPAMIIGTIGAEFQLKATALNQPITPSNVDLKEQTRYGSFIGNRPHRLGSAVLFLQRGGNRFREMTYDFTIDAFVSKDLNIISEHILRRGNGGYRSTSQQEPTNVVWCILNDGTVATMTYERDQEVVAWTLQRLGGGGIVESITSVPSTDGQTDNIYMVVRRTINGSTKRYIERVEIDFNTDRGDTIRDMFYVDCGLTYAGSPATTISGLDHLTGAIVQVVADGNYLGTSVVSGGSITLATPASKVHVGLGSVATIVTLDPEGGSQAGTSQGKVKRVNYLSIRVKDTLPFKAGPSEDKLLKITQDDFRDLKTGDVRLSIEQPYGLSGAYVLSQDEPVPMNIVALMPQLNTNE